MIIDALKGKGIGGSAVRIGAPNTSGGSAMRIGAPPPFIGTWPNTSGRGKKKN